MDRKHNKEIVPTAKKLRKNMTKEERHLWYDFLCTYPMRFSRQKVLGKYIDIIKQDTCKITVLVPNTIDKEKLLEAWETKDVKQASTDINDILSRLSPEQREQVLNHINHLKK